MFANLRKLTDPAELGPFMDSNLVGQPRDDLPAHRPSSPPSASTTSWCPAATPGTPIGLRQRMMTRFAEEVCPQYSQSMRRNRRPEGGA